MDGGENVDKKDILYFEILSGIENYLKASSLEGTPMLEGFTGDKMCEKAAKELQAILPKYIEDQKDAIINLIHTNLKQ